MKSNPDSNCPGSSAIPRLCNNAADEVQAGEIDRLRTDLQRLDNELYEIKNLIKHLAGMVENGNIGTKNGFVHIGSLIENAAICSKNAIGHVAGLVENTAINTRAALETVAQDAIVASLSRVLAVEARLPREQVIDKPAIPRPRPLVTFEGALEQVRAAFPRQFDYWQQRLWAADRAIATTVVGNLAHAGDPYSIAFKSFVEVNAAGAILDVGCGPLGQPYYLSAFDPRLLCGLDPIPQRAASVMPIIRGISECLPWEDGSFDTVISATSIDHALSLDRSLAEIARVLTDAGVLLMWIGSIPGAPRYDPASIDFAPADAFHLFHIDKTWFEPLLVQRFVMEDRVVLWRQSHEHVFYRLRRAAR